MNISIIVLDHRKVPIMTARYLSVWGGVYGHVLQSVPYSGPDLQKAGAAFPNDPKRV